MVCYATALVLVTVYNPDPTRPFRSVFSWVHRLSALCLIVLPVWTLLANRRDAALHAGNIRTAWRWRLDDIKWLALMGPATLNKRIVLPPQDKFNAAEKINFMVLTATVPLYAITGVMIWLHGVAYVSWLIHLSMAAAATPLMFGHIFMATVNPDTRVGLSGMLTGYVDRHWAQHHYGRWFDEHFAPAPPSASVEPETAQPSAAMTDVGSEVPAAVPPEPVPAAPLSVAPVPQSAPSALLTVAQVSQPVPDAS